MKKLIFRKFYLDIFKNFSLYLVILSAIVWTLQAINHIDFITEDGHGISVYFYYTLLNFPKIAHRLIPFVFFISLYFTILNYENRNELYIFWANGISKFFFTKQIIIFSIYLLILQIFLGAFLVPSSQLKARNYLKESNIDFFKSLIKPGKFINFANGLTIFINNENGNGNYENIFLDDTRNNSKMIYAKKGFFEENGQKKNFVLVNGRLINNDKSNITIFEFDKIDFDLSNIISKTITVPKIQEIGTFHLLRCILNKKIKLKDFNCSEKIKSDIYQQLFQRILKPFYIIMIALFCSILIIKPKTSNNHKYNRNLAFIFGFLTLLLSEASVRYINSSYFVFLINTILPITIFTVTYLKLKKRMSYV